MSLSARWHAAATELSHSRDLWPSAVPQEYIEPLAGATLDDYLQKWARERPQTCAVHYYGTDLTYKALELRVSAFAGWLQAAGVSPGDRVGVYLPNCPQVTVAFLGILRIGAVYVPVNPMFKAAELIHQLNDAGVSMLLALADFAPLIDGIRTQLTGHLTVAYTQLADMLTEPVTKGAPVPPYDETKPSDWEEIMSAEPETTPASDRTALAALNYTGGTTGLPKGCEHTQEHMIYTAVSANLGRGRTPATREPDIVLGFLPLFWIAGEDMCLLVPLINGGTVVLMTRWVPETAAVLIAEQNVTAMIAQVENYLELMSLPVFATGTVSSLRDCTCVSFARRLDPQLRQEWRRLTGTTLREAAYGMTETHTADTFTLGLDAGDQDLSTEPVYCGYPVPGTRIVIVDDDLNPVPIGEIGQILVQSPALLRGYFQKPEATAQVLTDGWLLTGDTGRFDEHGALVYLTRTKELIKVNGMSVYPAEVESLMRRHPDIAHVAVKPRDDLQKGQKPVAFVQLHPGSTTTGAELEEWAGRNMSVYKIPEIRFVHSMPMTATGKVRKVDLEIDA